MGNTGINYATKTWNPIEGCKPCSPGCERCWAKKFAHRAKCLFVGSRNFVPAAKYRDVEKWDGTLAEFPERWDEPLRWKKPQRVFVGSRSDIALWGMSSIMRVAEIPLYTPHQYLLLTKRPETLARKASGLLHLCWIGFTVCNQEEADEKIPQLLKIPSAGYWLSVEPMLGQITIPPALLEQIGWVVCGGESGKGARQMLPEWAFLLRDQCCHSGVPFWFKQWGDAYGGIENKLAGYEWHQLPDCLKLEGKS